ncbi:MAG: hypothetical protein II766_02570 [Paludibacteraceae bacterium]|nr:hypothetical protein [Paludibacteraceae bacterium]
MEDAFIAGVPLRSIPACILTSRWDLLWGGDAPADSATACRCVTPSGLGAWTEKSFVDG